MPHPTLLDESPGWADPYELVRANKRVVLGRLGITLQTTVWGERAGRTSRCTRQTTIWAGRMWTPLPPPAVGFLPPILWLLICPLILWLVFRPPPSPVVGFSPPCFHKVSWPEAQLLLWSVILAERGRERDRERKEKTDRERRKRKMDRKRQKKQE